MAKIADEQQESSAFAVAIKPKAYETLVKRVASEDAAMSTHRDAKSELIRNAVEANLHKAAFAVVMKLRKMDPVKRGEWLFHFDLYCERENFTKADLFADGETPDGEEDLRPRHLRQPGASASTAVQDLAARSGATVTPIEGVGRGTKAADAVKAAADRAGKPKLN